MELRIYENNYEPQYFDGLYELSKYQLVRGRAQVRNPPKYAYVVEASFDPRHASLYAGTRFSTQPQ